MSLGKEEKQALKIIKTLYGSSKYGEIAYKNTNNSNRDKYRNR